MSKRNKLQHQHGKLGEQRAHKYLQQQGYRVIETNWHVKYAEIDIVAVHSDTLVCVEVRTRAINSQDTPEESISYHKLNTLMHSIQLYKSYHPELPDALRIDLVAVTLDKGHVVGLNLIQNISQ